MNPRRALCLSLLVVALAGELDAQVQTRCIDLTFTDPPTDPLDNPFGLALDPDGRTLYVALSGGLGGTENSLVAALDVATTQILQRQRVGFYPEDFAIQTDAQGSLLYLYVTSSTSNQVDVLDGAFQHLGSIGLPPEPSFGTWFPFNPILNADQTRLYVSTVEGTGNLFVIDTDVSNPQGTFHQELPAERFVVPGAHGRLNWSPDGQTLIVPTTQYYLDFSGSDAGVTWIDPAFPSLQTSIVLAAGGSYPSTADTVLTSDGSVWVDINGGPSRLYVLDGWTGTLLSTLELGGAGGEYGMTLEPNGRFLYIADLFVGDVLVVDTETQSLETVFNAGTGANDVAFTRDGSRAFISDQATQCLTEATRLPRAPLALTGDSLPINGGTASYRVAGGTEARAVTLFGSLTGAGPTPVGGGIVIDLSLPIVSIATLGLDIDGRAQFGPIPVPSGSNFVGVNVFLQAATVELDGRALLSNPFTAIIQ